MKSGIELIADERKKQIEKHGYDLAHDKQHKGDYDIYDDLPNQPYDANWVDSAGSGIATLTHPALQQLGPPDNTTKAAMFAATDNANDWGGVSW